MQADERPLLCSLKYTLKENGPRDLQIYEFGRRSGEAEEYQCPPYLLRINVSVLKTRVIALIDSCRNVRAN